MSYSEIKLATRIPPATLSGWIQGKSIPPVDSEATFESLLVLWGVDDAGQTAAWKRALGRVRLRFKSRPGEPYRGLESYRPEDARWFHGRDRLKSVLADRLAQRFRSGGLVLVGGPSGSGKSSLLAAGIADLLDSGAITLPTPVEFLPVRLSPGNDPARALVEALSAGVTPEESARRVGDLTADPAHAVTLVQQLCESAAPTGQSRTRRSVFLIVDQLEDIYAPEVTGRSREVFLSALAAVSRLEPASTAQRTSAALVVVGLRSDFYPQAMGAGALREAMQDGHLLVGSMTRSELREAITGPATTLGVSFAEGLVELILRELEPGSRRATAEGEAGDSDQPAHERGMLPFISHTLRAMWETSRHHPGRSMTLDDYRATGGIKSAIRQTAQTVYDPLTETQKSLARLLFMRLVRVAEDSVDTLRRVSYDELVYSDRGSRSDELTDVLQLFVDGRLISVDHDSVEISHNSLLAAWPELGRWIEADRPGAIARGKLTDAARNWDALGRQPTELYSDIRLAAAQEWANDEAHRGHLNRLERDFLSAGIRRQESETQKLRRRVAILSILVISLILVGAYAVVQRHNAISDRDAAISTRLAEEAARLRESDPSLAAQLAVSAYRISPTPRARSSLLDGFGGPPVTRILSPSAVRQTVAFTADGSIMATAGADQSDPSIRLWGLSDPRRPRAVGDPVGARVGAVYGMAFSPDARTLAVVGSTGDLEVWDVGNRQAPTPEGSAVHAIDGNAFAVDYSHDGHTIAVGGSDHTIRLFDLSEPAKPVQVGPPLQAAGDVQAIAFSPDGHLLAAGDLGGSVHLWQLGGAAPATGPGTPIAITGGVFAVAFNADGHILATGGDDKLATLWNVADPAAPVRLGQPLTGPTARLNSLTMSSDGLLLAAGSSDSATYVWNLADPQRPATRLPHPGLVTSAHFLDPAGHALATTGADGSTQLWRLPGPLITDPTFTVYTAALSPDGRTLLVGHDGNQKNEPRNQKVRLWDVSDRDNPRPLSPPLGTDPGLGLSGAAALSPDGRTVAAGSRDGLVLLWDVADPAHPLALGALSVASDNIEAVMFRPDHLMAVGSDDHTIALWNLADPRHPSPVTVLREPRNAVQSVAFTDDGRVLAAGSADPAIWLYDVTNPAQPTLLGGGPLRGPTKPVYSVAFSHDGHTLAAGSADNNVRLWDLHDMHTPKQLDNPLTGPRNVVYWLAFSPDDHVLAAAVGNGTVFLWDTSDSHQPTSYAELAALPGQIWYVSFSGDGHTLAAGSSRNAARLWETDPEQAARYICDLAGDGITRDEWAEHIPERPFTPPCSR